MKYLKYICLLFPLLFVCLLYSCSSGEYDKEEHSEEYVEKTIKADTLRKDTTSIVKKEERKEEFVRSEKYTYVIQLGAFLIKSNYENFIAKARTILGNEVYDTYINNLYKIRIGKFTDRIEALNLLNKVKNFGFYDAFIITTKQ